MIKYRCGDYIDENGAVYSRVAHEPGIITATDLLFHWAVAAVKLADPETLECQNVATHFFRRSLYEKDKMAHIVCTCDAHCIKDAGPYEINKEEAKQILQLRTMVYALK